MTEKKFNVTRDNEGKVIGIEFNAEAFIIPNHSGTIGDFLGNAPRRIKELATNVLGKEPEEDEKYIQMWYTSDDINCENLTRHYPSVTIDGTRYSICVPEEYLPYSILKNKDDGDVIDVKFINKSRYDDEEDTDIEVLIHVTLNQKDYRYRRFGSFRETLQKVL